MTVKDMVDMKKRRKLGRGVAIVGAGMSKFGMFKDKDSKDLFAEAFNGMMASVGGVEEMSKRTTEEVAEGFAHWRSAQFGRHGRNLHVYDTGTEVTVQRFKGSGFWVQRFRVQWFRGSGYL